MFILLSLFFLTSTVHAAVFTDVPTTHPYYTSIESMRQQRIFRGYSDGKFYPNVPIARIEFAHALITALFTAEEIANCNIDDLATQLTDINYADWYGQTLCIAQTEHIIGGHPNGTFEPEKAVNFAEAATILVRAYSVLQSVNHTEEDAIWYRPYIQDMSKIQAIPPSITGPDYYVKRSEIAEMMYRLQLISFTGQPARRSFIEASEFNRGGEWEEYIAANRLFTLHYPIDWQEPYRITRSKYWDSLPSVETSAHTYIGPKPTCRAQTKCLERTYVLKEYNTMQWDTITEELLQSSASTILVDETTNGVQMVIFEETTPNCIDRTVLLKSRRFLYGYYAECGGSSNSRKRLLQQLVETLELPA